MNVYTYYQPIQGVDLWSSESQLGLIEVWKRSWAKQGWNPVVLCEADAARHPQYSAFKKKFWELPTPYGHEFDGACFMRWVAMSVWNGGMLTDYDVINYDFRPRDVVPDKMILFVEPPHALFMGAVLAPKNLYEEMSQIFLNWVPDDRDWNASTNSHHCSDLTYFMQIVGHKNKPRPAWFVMEPGCSEYPDKQGSMVHFGYRLIRDGYSPKYKWIEKHRPL